MARSTPRNRRLCRPGPVDGALGPAGSPAACAGRLVDCVGLTARAKAFSDTQHASWTPAPVDEDQSTIGLRTAMLLRRPWGYWSKGDGLRALRPSRPQWTRGALWASFKTRAALSDANASLSNAPVEAACSLPDARATASHRNPVSGRRPSLSVPRDRQPASIVGRARVVLRSPIHLLHLDISSSRRHLSTGDFHRADKNFHATHNVHER